MEETDLIGSARGGDLEAFRSLFETHHGRIFGLAYRYLRNTADAEDVLQETFIRAYHGLDAYDPGRGRGFAQWINRICVNCSLDAIRRTRVRGSDSPEEPALDQVPSRSPEDDPERSARNKEVRRRIDQTLDRLSNRQRTIFTLRHDLGFTTREIAEQLGSSEGAVKRHLFRAVAALRKRLRPFIWENDYEL